MKKELGLTALVIAVSLLFTTHAFAGRFWDRTRNVRHTYDSTEELVGLIVHSCAFPEQLEREAMEDNIMYMIMFNLGKNGSRNRTLADVGNLIVEKGTQLHHTLDEAVASEEFENFSKSLGKKNTYLQAIDVRQHKVLGLYNSKKNKVADPNDNNSHPMTPIRY